MVRFRYRLMDPRQRLPMCMTVTTSAISARTPCHAPRPSACWSASTPGKSKPSSRFQASVIPARVRRATAAADPDISTIPISSHWVSPCDRLPARAGHSVPAHISITSGPIFAVEAVGEAEMFFSGLVLRMKATSRFSRTGKIVETPREPKFPADADDERSHVHQDR